MDAHSGGGSEEDHTVAMIDDALAAQVDQSKPALGNKDRDELHRLAALWVAKCGRSQTIVEDDQLKTLLARILELCKCQLLVSCDTRSRSERRSGTI